MNLRMRRMWARRALRAGWLLAPVLAAPGGAWRAFKKHPGNLTLLFFLLAFAAAIIIGLVVGIYHAYQGSYTATPEQIFTALKGNECISDLVSRRQAQSQQPILVYDLRLAESDCAKWKEKEQIVNQQKAAIESAKK